MTCIFRRQPPTSAGQRFGTSDGGRKCRGRFVMNTIKKANFTALTQFMTMPFRCSRRQSQNKKLKKVRTQWQPKKLKWAHWDPPKRRFMCNHQTKQNNWRRSQRFSAPIGSSFVPSLGWGHCDAEDQSERQATRVYNKTCLLSDSTLWMLNWHTSTGGDICSARASAHSQP